MSQILASRTKNPEILLFQDLYFSKRMTPLKSSVKEAACVICEKGLDEGLSVTAMRLGQRMRFFCEVHLPKGS